MRKIFDYRAFSILIYNLELLFLKTDKMYHVVYKVRLFNFRSLSIRPKVGREMDPQDVSFIIQSLCI